MLLRSALERSRNTTIPTHPPARATVKLGVVTATTVWDSEAGGFACEDWGRRQLPSLADLGPPRNEQMT
jgi:hypothetical protein